MKDKIIDEAINLFQRDGFDFKLDELAKNLHISKKTIYRYFKSKEDIFRTFIQESFESTHLMQKEIFDNGALSTEEKLIGILSSRSKYEDRVSIEKTMGIKDYYPELYTLILQTYMTQWDKVESLIRQGIKEGIYRKDINIEIVKNLLIEGMQMMHKNNLLEKSGLTYREAIKQLITLVMDGIHTKH